MSGNVIMNSFVCCEIMDIVKGYEGNWFLYLKNFWNSEKKMPIECKEKNRLGIEFESQPNQHLVSKTLMLITSKKSFSVINKTVFKGYLVFDSQISLYTFQI
jgi:hypothetical protein